MKIAYLVTRADPIGGAQIHVRDLAASIQAHGHSPTVLIGGQGPFVDDLRARGIPLVSLRHLVGPMHPLLDLRALGEIIGALRDLRPDLLTAHGSKSGILGRLAARSLGVPLVVTVHGWACAPGTPRLQAAVSSRLERLIGRLANKTIAVSEFDRQFGLANRLVAPERIVTVHNGMPDIAPSLRADPSRSPARLIMVARFEPQKDHRTLLSALGRLRTLPWQLDLVGDGPLRPEMESLAASLGIAERVRFLGQRTDVAQLISDAQVGVLVSHWEGFPLSILEAMRAGLPVVASDVGGVSEAVLNDETGYVVPRSDVEALKHRIGRLLDSPDLRARLGSTGRARYEQEFTLEHLVAKTVAVYQDALKVGPGRIGLARPEAERASGGSSGDRLHVGG